MTPGPCLGSAASCTPSKSTHSTSAKAPEHICCSSVNIQLLESPTHSPGLFSPFTLHSIKFTVGQGKEGIIDFISGSELLIAKAKNGHLTVVSVGWGSLPCSILAWDTGHGMFLPLPVPCYPGLSPTWSRAQGSCSSEGLPNSHSARDCPSTHFLFPPPQDSFTP